MSYLVKCKECKGELEVLGLGGSYNDLITVKCKNCEEIYEVEQDGLGDAGLEFVDAMLIDPDINSCDF